MMYSTYHFSVLSSLLPNLAISLALISPCNFFLFLSYLLISFLLITPSSLNLFIPLLAPLNSYSFPLLNFVILILPLTPRSSLYSLVILLILIFPCSLSSLFTLLILLLVTPQPESNYILTFRNDDSPGVISQVLQILHNANINVASLNVTRAGAGQVRSHP